MIFILSRFLLFSLLCAVNIASECEDALSENSHYTRPTYLKFYALFLLTVDSIIDDEILIRSQLHIGTLGWSKHGIYIWNINPE